MEKHQEQLAKYADVNSAESLYRLSKEIFGSTRKKAAKILCHFMFFRKYAIIHGKTVCIAKSLLRALQCECLFFPLGISIICTSFCHLATKSLVMGYICCSMLHAALFLPLPSRITSQYSLFYPQPSAYLTALNRMVPMKIRRGIALAHSYTKQQAQSLLNQLKLHLKVLIQQKVFSGRRLAF